MDILHFRGNIAPADSLVLKSGTLFISALAAAAYICQYAILKNASSHQALIWLGCQGVLAGARVAYWIYDPSFDNSVEDHGEYLLLNNIGTEHVTLPELICATIGDKPVTIPG